MMRPVVKMALAASATLLLSGCWQSNTPLIPEAEVDKVKLAKAYETVEVGATKPMRYRMEKDGKRWKAFKQNADGKPETGYRLSFDKLVGKFYLVQMMDAVGQKVEAYRIFDLSSKREMIVWEPACNDEDDAEAYVYRNGSTCRFDDYRALKKRALVRAAQISNGNSAGGTLDKTYKAAKNKDSV